MQQQVFQQHFIGILHSEGNHGQTIANQDHFHPCSFRDERTGEVMGSDHGDWLTIPVEFL